MTVLLITATWCQWSLLKPYLWYHNYDLQNNGLHKLRRVNEILDPSLYNLIHFIKTNENKTKQTNKNTKMQHKTKKLQKRPIYFTRQGKMY